MASRTVWIFTPERSLSSGTASANFGMDEWCSKMDLRTRAVPEGARAPSIPINWGADAAFWD
ncbi:hypothetical protein [Pullulanibacillus pueri]|uniref:hypothetical protein n=1 Tax=Pullulanibacillus pueri TaxID=1437324 RepID=UPI00166C9A22|nr:hypothetical protein [Pullulanibacillus pueri]